MTSNKALARIEHQVQRFVMMHGCHVPNTTHIRNIVKWFVKRNLQEAGMKHIKMRPVHLNVARNRERKGGTGEGAGSMY